MTKEELRKEYEKETKYRYNWGGYEYADWLESRLTGERYTEEDMMRFAFWFDEHVFQHPLRHGKNSFILINDMDTERGETRYAMSDLLNIFLGDKQTKG